MSGALELEDLRVTFETEDGTVAAVNGVSLTVTPGRVLAVVGESGSGKSVSMMAAMGLLPTPPARVVSGDARFDGRSLVANGGRHAKAVRGRRLAMVFQDPLTSLNPFHTCGRQVAEAVRRHQRLGRGAARRRVRELFREVGIPAPESRAAAYPHQLSGGLRQRVLIAMALAGDPDVVIADEPTTALDVTVQAQILELFRGLCRDRGLALCLITHDMGVVATLADRVAVMYAGRVVEEASVTALFSAPRHPYTRGLWASIPGRGHQGELSAIGGFPPDPRALPAGCPFAPRCADRVAACAEDPAPRPVGDGRVACHVELPE